jgi:rfaE bifunctional protein kinase chain/domain
MDGLSRTQVMDYVERFTSARICVLGDVMLDRYFWGQVDRISPEAPVPVVKVNRRSARLGGAANVAANLSTLGVHVELAGIIGDDRAGDDVMRLLAERNIGTTHAIVAAGHETTEKVRIIAQHQQVVRADFEMEPDPADGPLRASMAGLSDKAADFDCLIVSDYGKGVVQEDSLRGVIQAWRGAGKPVLIDPHVGHFRWYAGASIVTPNTKQAASFFGSTIKREELFESLGFRMRSELAIDALLITRGEEGMSLFVDDRRVDIATVATEVFDVTGAGDTVISVLGAGVASGVPLTDAVILANQAAGEVVKEVGTSAITADDLVNSFMA